MTKVGTGHFLICMTIVLYEARKFYCKAVWNKIFLMLFSCGWKYD